MTTCGFGDKADHRLTWDGESCTYEGPTELVAGPVAIDFVNESEEVLKVNLMRHTGDQTIQDMVDHVGPEPSAVHQPPWVVDLGTWDYPVWTEEYPAFTGRTVKWEGDLEAGTYTIVCAQVTPSYGVWFGTGLIVSG